MQPESPGNGDGWDEAASQLFIDYGRYFVPQRQRQAQIIASLVPGAPQPFSVFDLGCGDGLLCEAILERFPACLLVGLDGSERMLRRARERLARFGERFQPRRFDLFERSWPVAQGTLMAVVSSLAIHHLDGRQKQELFAELQRLLAPGGALLIADLVQPAQRLGWELAAREWDEAVRRASLELDGDLRAFQEFERQRWNLFRYFDAGDIDRPSPLFDQLKWLEAAGFVGVDVFWMSAGHAIFGGRCPG